MKIQSIRTQQKFTGKKTNQPKSVEQIIKESGETVDKRIAEFQEKLRKETSPLKRFRMIGMSEESAEKLVKHMETYLSKWCQEHGFRRHM